ncbi:hypothetical protein ILYODFUR_025219 [Ilyodon furcidens]|uniref:Secreted protein n=1 Tax=Ilyodon furcidens TaxID=33524 RepID=A0ABV0VHE3_9TELE
MSHPQSVRMSVYMSVFRHLLLHGFALSSVLIQRASSCCSQPSLALFFHYESDNWYRLSNSQGCFCVCVNTNEYSYCFRLWGCLGVDNPARIYLDGTQLQWKNEPNRVE